MIRELTLAVVIVLHFFFTSSTLSFAQESPHKLPYPAGKEYTVRQGNFGSFSHGKQHFRGYGIYAFDFTLTDGDPMVASRAGTVFAVKDNSNTGGCDESSIGHVNYVIIDHGDGTSALYLHLQYNSVTVKEGELIEQGQEIARADSTGYVCGAHLHFQVQETPQDKWHWYTQSIQISFSDADVLAKTPDGVPIEGESYVSDNALLPKVSGERIAYIGQDSNLYLINSDGTGQRKLLTGSVMTFEWLPDGKRILYNRGGMDSEGVFLINIKTGEETQIKQEPFMELSPDGKQFLYWEGEFSNLSLAIFDLENSSSKTLPIQQTYQRLELGVSLEVNALIWSPDGKKIAYIDDNFIDIQTGMRGTAVWMMNIDALEKELIWSNTLGAVANPIFLSWSPDGQKIGLARVLVRQGLGKLTYELFDLGSKSSQTILDISYEPRWCGGILPKLMDVYWTKESAKVILSFPEDCWRLTSSIVEVEPTLSSSGLWLLEERKEPKLISKFSGYNGIDISPDGTSLVFSGNPPLYAVNIDGTDLRNIVESGSRPAWQPIQH
ncbi:hypothetical protein LCGC14_0102600 [marine sediment metagenome]|uniref:M23ase beta-sheet core domain-containing protein n=1 Tax=marine sediment metagenome TaxID=412755 RepID=A0A0F9VFK6_9ZZZZ|nr:hypothetical protein [Candidatus Nealsonbacteria bacterium]